MPPYHLLSVRSEPAGSNFTIIFCTISSVTIVCLVGSLAILKMRRDRQRCPLATSSTTPISDSSSPVVAFPSHPALCRRLEVRQYDHKHETRFPKLPTVGNSISMASTTHNFPGGSIYSRGDGPFKPARASADDLHFAMAMPSAAEADYIHPLPEPCLLRARSCGKAPSLRKQLDKFPIPQSSTRLNDKLAHPNKLFKDLERDSSRVSIGMSTPITTFNESEKNCTCLQASKQDDTSSLKHGKICARTVKPRTLELPEEYVMKHRKLRRLHRRGTWSSAANSSHLEFMVQRPDTSASSRASVAATQIEDGNEMVEESASKRLSTLSKDHHESTASSSRSRWTRPTSTVDAATIHPHNTQGVGRTDSPGAFPGPEEAHSDAATQLSVHSITPMYSIPEDNLADSKKGSTVGQVRSATRHCPTELKLINMRKSASLPKRIPQHSRPSVRSLLVPLVRPRMPSFMSGSAYSRDTLGISLTPSPVSPTFSENASTRTTPDTAFRVRKAVSAIDLLKTKIDDWRLETAPIQISPTSLSAEFKRAMSDLYPYSPTFRDSGFASVGKMDNDGAGASETKPQNELPTICIGRSSDDIFQDPLDESNDGAKPDAAVPRKGSAPGGAEWV